MDRYTGHSHSKRRTRTMELGPPRIAERGAFLVAGLSERHSPETMEEIAVLWQRFMPHIGNVPGQLGSVAYGVCSNSDGHGNFDYLAGVEVSETAQLPPQLTAFLIARQRYAVFTHRGHILTIPHAWAEIFGRLLSDAGLRPLGAPSFERYDERFDPASGSGEVEIWVPLRPAVL